MMDELNDASILKRVPVPLPAQPATSPLGPPVPTVPVPSQATASPTSQTPTPGPAELNLTRVQQQGSGISRIHNPVLKTLATVGDVLAGTFAPRAEMLIPGTEGHHALELGQAERAVKGEQESAMAPIARRKAAAEAAEQENLPAYHQALTDVKNLTAENTAERNRNVQAVNQAKAETEAEKNKNTYNVALRKLGIQVDETGKIAPIPREDLSDTERSHLEDTEALTALRAAQTETQQATAQLRQAQAAGEPEKIKLATARLGSAQASHEIAIRRLGLSEQMFNARYQGVGPDGKPLAGSMIADNGQVVPPVNAANVRPTTQERDAAGRAQTLDQLDLRIRAALNNPELRNRTGPILGRLNEMEGKYGSLPHDLAEFKNDLVSYGAFQAGLHPVRGIGALEYFDKVMGGLGQTPEQLLGKLDSNTATSKSVQKVGTPKTVGSNAANPVDPKVKAYADQFFGGDLAKAQAEIDKQRGAKK